MAKRTCSIDGCEKPVNGRGWCKMHYTRWLRGTAVERPSLTVEQRFWQGVRKSDYCWEWSGARSSGGYGRVPSGGRDALYAHRFAYELLVGPIPEGLQIDHLCRNRACCNPIHLEPVTPAENVRRGAAGRLRVPTTHCPHGHPMTESNVYLSKHGGYTSRICRVCHLEVMKRQRRRKAVARAMSAA